MKYFCLFLFASLLAISLSTASCFSQPTTAFRADATVNVSDTVVFRLNDYVGEHVKWQFSHNLSDWTDIPGATADSLMFVADTTTYFRARVIAGFCDPFHSDTLKVAVIHQDGQGTVVDIDGNVYPTVVIGYQEWMAENLRVTRDPEGNNITRYCYGNENINCERYGGLYTWHTLMNAENTRDADETTVQGICPDGWHVPGDADWTQLTSYVGGSYIGNRLKSCRQVFSPLGGDCNTEEHPRWDYHHIHHGIDEYGFAALPGGYRRANGLYAVIGKTALFWTSTLFMDTIPWLRHFYHDTGYITRYALDKSAGLSVRCVRYVDTYSLHLEVHPENAGVVNGAGEYPEGKQVNIVAVAGTGWTFVNWIGDTDYIDDPASANATFTMPAQTITLKANFQPQEDLGNVTDIDGNIYNIILIDDQKWLVENLRVTRYNNGDPIPTGLNDTQWGSTTEGAYAIYDHNDSDADGINSPEEMVAAYGKLYNCWAVDDPRGLCPEGWRAPTDDECKAVEVFLGMDIYEVHDSGWRGVDEGGKQKSMRTEPEKHPRWNLPNTLASDEIRFSLFPSGFREHHGVFTSLGHASLYWTSTTNADVSAWYRTYSTEWGTIGRFVGWNNYGFAVRCVKEPVTYNLQMEYSPENSGNVNGAGEYTEGEEVNIEATSNPGWRFLEWTGDTGYLVDPTAPNNTVNMPAYDISLTANFTEGDIIYGDGVTDIDGNEYVTVVIGEQEWMAANLRVTKYNNGDPISLLRSISEEPKSTEGVYAIYPHDNVSGIDSPEEMAVAYGILYNWYAVDDSRGLCPAGWHAPTDDEWTELVNYVEAQGYPDDWGSFNGAGNALKSCRQVNSPLDGDCNTSVHPRWNLDGTHYGFEEFGFSALPGGGSWSDGSFLTLGTTGFWWTATQHSPTSARMHNMSNYSGKVSHGSTNKLRTLSLRCVREN